MAIKFFCPRWGSENLPWLIFFQKVKSAGYDGVEMGITAQVSARELGEIWNLAGRQGLLMIAQHHDTNFADFGQHRSAYASWLNKIEAYSWHKINSQTGKDFFSFDQNSELIELAGARVIHETHRGKFAFAAHITKDFLGKMPDLKLTLDLSHWVNTAESYLEDQQEALLLAISRTAHIHARVGYPEGPQVIDPRLPVWKQALDMHLDCWDLVVRQNPSVSITPEFGPFPYMQIGRDDQWELNKYMLDILKRRYCPDDGDKLR